MCNLLKDTLNIGHNISNLSVKNKFCGPHKTIAIQFTFNEDNLCIIVKLHQY